MSKEAPTPEPDLAGPGENQAREPADQSPGNELGQPPPVNLRLSSASYVRFMLCSHLGARMSHGVSNHFWPTLARSTAEGSDVDSTVVAHERLKGIAMALWHGVGTVGRALPHLLETREELAERLAEKRQLAAEAAAQVQTASMSTLEKEYTTVKYAEPL